MVGGNTLWCSAITALNSPAAPAAALVCPICDFTVPMAHHWRSLRPVSSNAWRRPSNSAASPALVPVPWASTSSTVDAGNPACSYARRRALAWPSGTGAYTDLLRPSDDAPTPLSTA